MKNKEEIVKRMVTKMKLVNIMFGVKDALTELKSHHKVWIADPKRIAVHALEDITTINKAVEVATTLEEIFEAVYDFEPESLLTKEELTNA